MFMSQGLSTPRRTKKTPARTRRTATRPPERGAARGALLAAARAEFDECGFEGTDTNRIARRAGYAPQTFYRHFKDKTAIFVEIYKRWFEDEWKDLENAHGKGADGAARVLLEHHARHREFRRSLRRLTITDETVRTARTASRRHQLELVDAEDRMRGHKRETALRVALLFCTERLADAAADGELADLGLSHEEQVALLADVLRRLRLPTEPKGSSR
jgi:AcrR family transcriptional regulator